MIALYCVVAYVLSGLLFFILGTLFLKLEDFISRIHESQMDDITIKELLWMCTVPAVNTVMAGLILFCIVIDTCFIIISTNRIIRYFVKERRKAKTEKIRLFLHAVRSLKINNQLNTYLGFTRLVSKLSAELIK